MYSDKLQAIKAQYAATDKGATLGFGVDYPLLEKMLHGFCVADDAVNVKHETLFDLFDEYCRENSYPIVNRQTLGRAFCKIFGLARKKAYRDGKLCWIYVRQ